MRKLTDAQPTYTVPADIPDTDEDRPVGEILVRPSFAIAYPVLLTPGDQPRIGHGQWPSIVFGAATLGAGIYNTEEVLNSPEPLRTVRLALR
jgi:hypothetical protein